MLKTDFVQKNFQELGGVPGRAPFCFEPVIVASHVSPCGLWQVLLEGRGGSKDSDGRLWVAEVGPPIDLPYHR